MFLPIEVRVHNNEPIESALRRFKRECEKDRLMAEIKRRSYFESPSEKRQKKLAEAKRKQRQQAKREERLKRTSFRRKYSRPQHSGSRFSQNAAHHRRSK